MGRDCAPWSLVEPHCAALHCIGLPMSLPVESPSRQTHGWWGPTERPPAGTARWQSLQLLQPLIPACSPFAKVVRASPAWAMRSPSAACGSCGTPEFLGKTSPRPWAGAVAWRAGGACVKGMPVTSGSACLAPSHEGGPSGAGGVRGAKDKACEIVQQGKEGAVPCKGTAQDALAGRWRGGCLRRRAVRGPNLASNLLVFPYSCIGGMNDNFACLLSNLRLIVERLLFVPVAY